MIYIDLLHDTVRRARKRYPFHIDAWVVLPEHMHSVWTLPPGDSDFSTRWRLIKSGFLGRSRKPNAAPKFAVQRANARYGSDIIESMRSATMPIMSSM
ncbi:hypothetical protein [Methylotuvimicrobium sp. KM2]|uniref:hypothetical protein n=1 Tax=Methylotuvimicrobium sp. KM2 TaxID=3133976 RepID=UPI003100E848